MFSLATTQVKAPPVQPRIIHDARDGRKVRDVRPGDLVITDNDIYEYRADGHLWGWRSA